MTLSAMPSKEPPFSALLIPSAVLALLAGPGLELAVRIGLSPVSALEAGTSDAVVLRTAACLTSLTVFLSVFTLLFARAFYRGLRCALREQALPPTGWPSIRPRRPVSGPPAVLVARVGLGLVGLVGLCGIALGASAVWFASRVIACAARHF